MLGWLILLFVLLPLLDLVLLIKVGSAIGALPTIALAIGTGILGAALARRQGLGTLVKINNELAAGRMPTTELAEGLLILLAAAVLICPGFITDGLGLVLLVPPARRLLVRLLARFFAARISVTQIHVGPPGGFAEGDATPFNAKHAPFDSFGNRMGPDRPVKYVKNEAMEAGGDGE